MASKPRRRCRPPTRRCETRSIEQATCEELSNQASLGRIAAAYAVASSTVAQVQADVQQVESMFCGQFDAATCPPPVAPPCVPLLGAPRAVCQSSRYEVEFVEP